MSLGAAEAITFLTFAAQASKVLIEVYDAVKNASKDLKKLREELSNFCFLVTSLANLLQSSEQYSSRSGTPLSRSIAVYLDNSLSQLIADLQEYGEFLQAMDPEAARGESKSAERVRKTWTKIKWIYGQKEAEKFGLQLLRHKTSLSLAFAAAQSEQLHAIQTTMATQEKIDELFTRLTLQQNTLTATSSVEEGNTVTEVSEVSVVQSVVTSIAPPPPYVGPPPSYISLQGDRRIASTSTPDSEEQEIEEVRRDVKPSTRRKHTAAVKQTSKAVITASSTRRFQFPFGELKVTLSDVTKNVSARFSQKQYKVNFVFVPSQVFDTAVEGGWTSWRNLRGSLSVRPHLGCRKVVPSDSAVMRVARAGDVEGMRRLFMEGKADTSDMTSEGFTALHYAAQNAHVEMCQFLLDNACDVSATGPAGLTALHYAASWGALEVLQLLVGYGKSDPTITDNFGFNALFQALYSPHISSPAARSKILRWLVSQDDFVIDLNEQDINGRTPLCMAARVEPSTALLLIQHGANPHLTDLMGTAPIHNAAASGFAEVVDALIAAGVDVNPRNVHGQTPLFLAVSTGHFPVVCRLIQAGAHVNVKALPADTELHKAAEAGRVDILSQLLLAGGDPNVKGLWAENALHRAAKKGHFAAVKLMLEHGGDIHAKNEHGYTPLHRSAWGGRPELLLQLVAHSRRLANKEGREDSLLPPSNAELKPDNEAESTLAKMLSDSAEQISDVDGEKRILRGRKPLPDEKPEDATSAIWEQLQTFIMNNDLPALRKLLELPEVCKNISAIDRWGVTALITASLQGSAAMVDLLLAHGAEIDKQDWWGRTALRRASDAWGESDPNSETNKFTEVIQRLIKAGANVDAQDDEDGFTALHIAAANGHIKMVDFFLSYGASIQLRDWWGRTPVQIAAESRKFNAVDRLLDCGAKVEYRPDDKERHLLQAAESGLVDLVESYLKEGVDVNSKGWLGENPLRVAAESNQLAVVDLLLKCGANVDIEDMWCRTALRRAAERGHTQVVERLLREGPNVNITDCEDSDTSMHRAAENGHVDSVRLLLEAKGDPTIRNRWGRTELRRANQRSVTLIRRTSDDTGAIDEDDVEDKEVNGNLGELTGSTKDGHKGDTPLHRASENGHLDVVEVILAHRVDVNMKGRFGDTPLHHAAEQGHLHVVERLLKEKPDLTRKGRYGDTPALRAERHGQTDIAALLRRVEKSEPEIHRAIQSNDTEALEEQLTDGVSPDHRNYWEETPLHLCASLGHHQLAKILLENKAQIDLKDGRGDTPLALAAENGHPKIVHMLLLAGANVNAVQRWGDTALHRAVEAGHSGILDRLLRGGASVNLKDYWGDIPLHRAAQNGHSELVKALLAAGADARAEGKWGDTPLHRAAQYGHRQVLHHLISSPSIPMIINARDKWRSTALHLAAYNDHPSCVSLLGSVKGIERDAKNTQGKTALDLAAEMNFEKVVKELVQAGVGWGAIGEYRNNEATKGNGERKDVGGLHFGLMGWAIQAHSSSSNAAEPSAVEGSENGSPLDILDKDLQQAGVQPSTIQQYRSYRARLAEFLVALARFRFKESWGTFSTALWDLLLWTGAAYLVLTVGLFVLLLERLTRRKPENIISDGTVYGDVASNISSETRKERVKQILNAISEKSGRLPSANGNANHMPVDLKGKGRVDR